MPAAQGRQYPQQMVHFLRKSIAYTDNGSTLDIGTLPANSVIIMDASGVHVTTAFNGDATNTLDIGPSTDTGTNLWMTVGALGTTTWVPFDEGVSLDVGTSDVLVQCKVVSTASASTGAAEIVICYVPDTDG